MLTARRRAERSTQADMRSTTASQAIPSWKCGISLTLRRHEETYDVNVRAIVIVDDFIGTGRTMAGNIQAFMDASKDDITHRNPVVRIVALCATSEGQGRVRDKLRLFQGVDIDLVVCEPLGPQHYAFSTAGSGWFTPEEGD